MYYLTIHSRSFLSCFCCRSSIPSFFCSTFCVIFILISSLSLSLFLSLSMFHNQFGCLHFLLFSLFRLSLNDLFPILFFICPVHLSLTNSFLLLIFYIFQFGLPFSLS